jgi:hypothetical protein
MDEPPEGCQNPGSARNPSFDTLHARIRPGLIKRATAVPETSGRAASSLSPDIPDRLLSFADLRVDGLEVICLGGHADLMVGFLADLLAARHPLRPTRGHSLDVTESASRTIEGATAAHVLNLLCAPPKDTIRGQETRSTRRCTVAGGPGRVLCERACRS